MSETHDDTETGQTQPEAAVDPSDPAAATAAIRAELAASERRYSEALGRARTAETRVVEVTTQLETTTQDRAALEVSTVNSALDAAQARAVMLQGNYVAAMEAGEFAKAGEISTELGRLGARIETLENGKQQLEQQRTQQLREAEKPEPRQASEDERQAADLAGRPPVVREWIKRQVDPVTGRMRFYNDATFANKLTAAHFDAMAERVPLNSPEYFAFVERKVGLAKPESPQQTQQTEEPRQRSAVPSAAPTRSAPAYRDNQGRSDSAIPSEAVRIAKQIGVDPVEYWKEHNRMEKAGEFRLGSSPFRRST